MPRAKVIALLLGLAMFAGVMAWVGPGRAAQAMAAAGWALAWVAAWRLPVYALEAAGWLVLFDPSGPRPSLGRLMAGRWVAEAANTLLPVAQVGGHVARTRLAAAGGVPLMACAAAVVADFIVGTATQFAFSLGGALMLLPRDGAAGWPILFLVLALLGLLAGLGAILRLGFVRTAAGLLERLAPGRRLSALLDRARELDQRLAGMQARGGRLALAAGWRLAGWLARAGETWLALWCLGLPVTLGGALALESLSMAAGSAAFVVPGGLGVREGSLVLVGGLLGVPAEGAVALGLVKRARELALGLPALAFYLWSEGRRAGPLGITPPHGG